MQTIKKVLTEYCVILLVGNRKLRYDVEAFDHQEAESKALGLENARQNAANDFQNTRVYAGSVNRICEPLQYQS